MNPSTTTAADACHDSDTLTAEVLAVHGSFQSRRYPYCDEVAGGDTSCDEVSQ